jgi:carboxymethylenebutenolidase
MSRAEELAMSKWIKLSASDGFVLDAYVAEPSGTPKGGLVVVQEIFGVNQHIRSVTDRFAAEGYLAVAPAIFDRAQPKAELAYDKAGFEQGYALLQRIPIDDTAKDVDAALEYAMKETGKPAGVVGFCYGGTLAWLSATRFSPAAAVGYYGGHIVQLIGEKPKAPVMLHFGKKDDHIPESDVAKIQAAHPEVQVYLYDAGHAFNRDGNAAYDEKSAKEAMARTLAFFAQYV